LEFFHDVNIDFLGKKWYFLAFSLIFSVAGVLSMLFWHHIPWGVDFRGGTLVYVKFSHTPDLKAVRAAMDRAGLRDPKIQSYGSPANNEVLIDLAQKETSEQALDEGKLTIIKALETNAPAGKEDLNNASSLRIKNYLMEKDPMRLFSDADQKYTAQTAAIVDYRDKTQGGVLSSMDQLKGDVDPAVVSSLNDGFFLSDFGVRNDEIVGPQVGSQLQKQAALATVYSLLGMLVYLGFRF
jgi:preprotein translocase subunit SecF